MKYWIIIKRLQFLAIQIRICSKTTRKQNVKMLTEHSERIKNSSLGLQISMLEIYSYRLGVFSETKIRIFLTRKLTREFHHTWKKWKINWLSKFNYVSINFIPKEKRSRGKKQTNSNNEKYNNDIWMWISWFYNMSMMISHMHTLAGYM